MLSMVTCFQQSLQIVSPWFRTSHDRTRRASGAVPWIRKSRRSLSCRTAMDNELKARRFAHFAFTRLVDFLCGKIQVTLPFHNGNAVKLVFSLLQYGWIEHVPTRILVLQRSHFPDPVHRTDTGSRIASPGRYEEVHAHGMLLVGLEQHLFKELESSAFVVNHTQGGALLEFQIYELVICLLRDVCLTKTAYVFVVLVIQLLTGISTGMTESCFNACFKVL